AAKPAKHTSSGLQSKAPPPKFKKHFSEMSEGDLADYLASIQFATVSDTTKYRSCEGDPNPESDKCNLEITAVVGSENVSTDDPSKEGRVVAKIRNIGTAREKTMDIGRGETVLWVVWERLKYWPFGGPNVSTFINSTDPHLRRLDKRKFK